MSRPRFAALDLGTNTFICLVAHRDPKALQVVYDEVQFVRLGEGLLASGQISEAALHRAEAALAKFSEKLRSFGVERALAVATSAARDAKNGHLLVELCQRYQIEIVIFTGDQEAAATFSGAQFDFPMEKPPIVIDVGGGSTEVITKNHDLFIGKSWDVGCVRLLESMGLRTPQTFSNWSQHLRHIDKHFENFESYFARHTDESLIAVAGTPVELTKLEYSIKGENIGFDESKIHKHFISKESLEKMIELIYSHSPEELHRKFNVAEKRADLLLPGALILHVVMSKLGKNGFFVSTKGLRYGVLQMMESGLI